MTAAPTPAAPSRWQEATIERIVRRTPRIASCFLRAALRPHVAGQHVDIRLTAEDGYTAQRSYSIASAPGADRIELLIERLDDGEVSPYFHDVAQSGDTLEIRGPLGGHFIWRAEDGGPLLLVAGGSGIAPLMAIARHRAAAALEVATLLVYSARRHEDLAFRDEWVDGQARDPEFAFVAITTREPARHPGDFDRRIDRALLRSVLDRWGRRPRHLYVCGANGFVETAAGVLVAEGIAPGHIRTERYGGSET